MTPTTDESRKKSRLAEFFGDSHNNTSREKMFFNRLYFDLKLAAAHSNCALSIFAPEVDRNGFDVSLDDGDLDRRFQLKTVLKTAGTKSWDIHKRLFRPSLEYAQWLGFAQSPAGIGLEGGFILIEIDNENDECPVTYRYTDIFIISAFADGLILDPQNAYRRTQARNLLAKLGTLEKGKDDVPVPVNLLVRVKDPHCLLAIAGMHSVERSYQWFGGYLNALRGGFRTDENAKLESDVDRAIVAHAQVAAEQLLELLNEKFELYGSDQPRIRHAR
ncbi:MAG: hypothetical protein JWO48_3760 [Bryobacterales bacterium]|nr:hypothetical protein [Bryobacterales bacterium]